MASAPACMHAPGCQGGTTGTGEPLHGHSAHACKHTHSLAPWQVVLRSACTLEEKKANDPLGLRAAAARCIHESPPWVRSRACMQSGLVLQDCSAQLRRTFQLGARVQHGGQRVGVLHHAQRARAPGLAHHAHGRAADAVLAAAQDREPHPMLKQAGCKNMHRANEMADKPGSGQLSPRQESLV